MYYILILAASFFHSSSVSSTWLGFPRIDDTVAGRPCIIVSPITPAPGNPWIWRTEFFGHEPQADSTLLAQGYHLVYIDVTDMYGSPHSLDIMDHFYQFLVKKNHLGRKAVLEGFSRGGLFALNWAARHPGRVSCLYLDAPVCDFKCWPGHQGKGPGSASDWEKMKKAYGFRSDEEALHYKKNPVDNLAPLARYKIPILSVCGALDTLVYISENSGLVRDRYTRLGGKMEIIVKPDAGHHPHSLKDPAPIVDFILRYGLH